MTKLEDLREQVLGWEKTRSLGTSEHVMLELLEFFKAEDE